MSRAAGLVLVLGMLLVSFGVAQCADASGGGGGGPGGGNHPPHRPPPPQVIGKFILAHATDLNLTDDQKTKIETWLKDHPGKEGGGPGGGGAGGGEGKAERHKGPPPGGGAAGGGGGGAGGGGAVDGQKPKGPFADILTKEQHDKLHELLMAARPQHGQGGEGGGQKPQ